MGMAKGTWNFTACNWLKNVAPSKLGVLFANLAIQVGMVMKEVELRRNKKNLRKNKSHDF